MITFHVNQRVICIDDKGAKDHVRRGHEYTVTAVRLPFLELDGVATDWSPRRGMYAERFRPLQSTEAGMAILRKLEIKPTVPA